MAIILLPQYVTIVIVMVLLQKNFQSDTVIEKFWSLIAYHTVTIFGSNLISPSGYIYVNNEPSLSYKYAH